MEMFDEDAMNALDAGKPASSGSRANERKVTAMVDLISAIKGVNPTEVKRETAQAAAMAFKDAYDACAESYEEEDEEDEGNEEYYEEG